MFGIVWASHLEYLVITRMDRIQRSGTEHDAILSGELRQERLVYRTPGVEHLIGLGGLSVSD
jgi:hypothetical protein